MCEIIFDNSSIVSKKSSVLLSH